MNAQTVFNPINRTTTGALIQAFDEFYFYLKSVVAENSVQWSNENWFIKAVRFQDDIIVHVEYNDTIIVNYATRYEAEEILIAQQNPYQNI